MLWDQGSALGSPERAIGVHPLREGLTSANVGIGFREANAPSSALASTSTRSECWRPNEVDRQQHLAGDPGGDIVADTRSEDEERTRR